MSDKYLKSLTFPDLADRYVVGDSSLSVSGAAADAKATGDALATKAEVDGAYESMTVGNAEQLVGTTFEEDSVPYNFRTSGGSIDIGDREYLDKIVGGTVAWNQLQTARDSAYTAKGITISATASDGSNSITGTRDSAGWLGITGAQASLPANHVALICANNMKGDLPTVAALRQYTQIALLTSNRSAILFKYTADATVSISLGGTVDNVWNGSLIPQIFDLTQMFGSTIADYIYSLEQATAGAGVAWFKKLFPKDYYEYNAGELISVSGLESHDCVGFNQWDEEWEAGGFESNGATNATQDRIRSKNFIPCVPSQTYYIKQGSLASTDWSYFLFYDADKNLIDERVTVRGTFTAPNNARYMKFNTNSSYGNTYNHDICINLSWSGYRNGEYEPYEKHSYPLDNSLTLRGIPKLDASNNLYYDGDEYQSDGSVSRRYGIVDLGTLTWYYNSASGRERFYTPAQTSVKVPSSESVKANVISSKYVSATDLDTYFHNADKIVAVSQDGRFYVYDTTYTDAAAFKTAMSGVYLVYELATPTTETAEPYQNVQICDDFGTEEFVSDSIVPVGHETRYPANLRDKLQHLPDLADADGYYMISQQNNNMSLELFRIPKAPTTDGNYTLKATVSGGTPTYTWESTESEGE